MADVIARLTANMANSAAGYAAIIDGVLNIRTTSETANAAALKAMVLLGCGVRAAFSVCSDVHCDCKIKLLAELRPDVKIVEVKVQVANG